MFFWKNMNIALILNIMHILQPQDAGICCCNYRACSVL